MVTILIWLALGLIAACLLSMLVFGVRHAGRFAGEGGLSLATLVLLAVVAVVMYLWQGSWTGAAVFTAMAFAVLGLIALFATGLKSLVK